MLLVFVVLAVTFHSIGMVSIHTVEKDSVYLNAYLQGHDNVVNSLSMSDDVVVSGSEDRR